MRGQGIGLVNVGADRHVVAANIKRADPFTKDDAAKLTGDRGYTLNQTFRSRVETTAGTRALERHTGAGHGPARQGDRWQRAEEAGAGVMTAFPPTRRCLLAKAAPGVLDSK